MNRRGGIPELIHPKMLREVTGHQVGLNQPARNQGAIGTFPEGLHLSARKVQKSQRFHT